MIYLYQIVETTDGKFVGHMIECEIKIGDIISLPNDFEFEIQNKPLFYDGFIKIYNPNYIIILTEVF